MVPLKCCIVYKAGLSDENMQTGSPAEFIAVQTAIIF